VPTWERALVTGASSGIGRAIARQLAQKGTALVLVARREQRLRALADEFAGLDVEVFPCDLTARPQREQLVTRLQSWTRPIDLVVNNAGIASEGLFHEISWPEHERVIELDVVALTELSHAPLARMIATRRGCVVNISSISGRQPDPTAPTYAASKAFVTSLSQSMHAGLRGTGVTVTAVLPGITPTEISGGDDAGERTRRPEIAMRRHLRTTADFVASEALAAAARGDQICVPGIANRALIALAAPHTTSIKGRVIGGAFTLARRLLSR
jgi:short-subunit dehydrogenase